MDAIPRLYKGKKFRSTLEARWAIFFDALGWRWEYEPFRLEGHDSSWIPDFVIFGYQEQQILCEVKPSDDPSENFDIGRYASLAFGLSDVVLLGNGPLHQGELHEFPALGWVHKQVSGQTEAAIFYNASSSIGFCDDYSSWACRITGEYCSQAVKVPCEEIRQRWFDSSSQVASLPTCDEPEYPTKVVRSA